MRRVAAKNPAALVLQRFLDGDQSTLLIYGAWGIGKSYAVKDFLESYDFRAKNLVVARSNVSLFGKESVAQVKASIFSSAVQVGTDELAKDVIGTAAQSVLKFSSYLQASRFSRVISWLNSKIGGSQVPWLGDLSSVMRSGNYDVVGSFMVVVDDLERRSSAMQLRDVLGIVDDLAREKRCKVICIVNEDALEGDDRSQFHAFREKVFDVEFRFSRPPVDVAAIGISDDLPCRESAVQLLAKLGISNIRVARKFDYFVRQFWREIEGADPRLQREILGHAALLTWARFDSSVGVPAEKFGSLSTSQSWMSSALKDGKAPKDQWEIQWDAGVDALQFSSEPYDSSMAEYLKSGAWDSGSLTKHLQSKNAELTRLDAQQALRVAWNIYSNSLNPDPKPFVSELRKVLREQGAHLSPRDVDGAFKVLEDLDGGPAELADEYLAANLEAVNAAALEDWPFEDFRSAALLPVVLKARQTEVPGPTIDSALSRIADNHSWSESDVATLLSCSEDDIRAWIRSEPDGLTHKIRDGLLLFNRLSGDVRYQQIGEKAMRVLRQFGAESEINRIRVTKMFKVSLD